MKQLLLTGLMATGLSIQAQTLPGSPDSTFNSTGFKFFDLNGNYDAAEGGIVDGSGRLWLAGYSNNNSYDITFCRFNPDGTVDQGFKANGIGTLDFSPNGTEALRDLYLAADGNVYGVGITEGPNDADVIVVKMDSTGTLDLNFGEQGRVVVDIEGGQDDGISMLVDKDGKIVVAGNSEQVNGDFFVLRLNANGSIDSSFSADGRVLFDELNLDNETAKLLERPEGGYYLLGTTSGGGDMYGTILSVSNNGNLNIDLGGPGKVNFQNNGVETSITSAVYFNKSLFLAGSFRGANDNADGYVARMHTNGTLDPAFNANGLFAVIHNLANQGDELINNVQVTSDSTLFLSGVYEINNVSQLLTVKLNIEGTKDAFYGNLNGMNVMSMPAPYTEFIHFGSVLSEKDGRLFLYGAGNGNNVDYFAQAVYIGKPSGGGPSFLTESNVDILTAFPNPSAGTLHLSVSGRLFVYDVQGRLAMETEANGEIHFADALENGVYFLKMQNGNNVYTSRIVLCR